MSFPFVIRTPAYRSGIIQGTGQRPSNGAYKSPHKKNLAVPSKDILREMYQLNIDFIFGVPISRTILATALQSFTFILKKKFFY